MASRGGCARQDRVRRRQSVKCQNVRAARPTLLQIIKLKLPFLCFSAILVMLNFCGSKIAVLLKLEEIKLRFKLCQKTKSGPMNNLWDLS